MAAPPPATRWQTSSIGYWLAVIVGLIAAVMLILMLVGQSASAPPWLIWLLVALLALARII